MVTALYMMEPLERIVINTIVVIMCATMMYSSWVYLPHYTVKMLNFVGILSTDFIENEATVDGFGVGRNPEL